MSCTTRMSSYLATAAVLCLFLMLAAADQDPVCISECEQQKVSCGESCQAFPFGPLLCEAMCIAWNKRCENKCPEVVSVADPDPGEPVVTEITRIQNSAKCGRSNTNRVIGGTSAGRCEYPWMVLIYDHVSHKICGGSIIDSRHILSAAHCFVQKNGETVPSNYLIVFSGSTQMPGDTGPRVYSEAPYRNYVEKVTVHPGYDADVHHDIAILRLRSDLPSNECHVPICLVSGEENPEAARGCRTMGWGTTEEAPGASPSRDMRWTGINILAHRQCQRIYGTGTATDMTLCAGGRGRDACSGDSGGPLTCRGPGGSFYQYGIVSLGLRGQCGKVAGLYTRVSSYLPWIQANII